VKRRAQDRHVLAQAFWGLDVTESSPSLPDKLLLFSLEQLPFFMASLILINMSHGRNATSLAKPIWRADQGDACAATRILTRKLMV